MGNRDGAESVLIKRFLLELGVPDDAVWVETRSRNTRENAVNTVPILAEHNWDSVLLVTSGAHMPRAVATFARAGIAVIPVSTDLHAHYPIIESLLDLLPDAAALAETTSVLREYLGFVYYRCQRVGLTDASAQWSRPEPSADNNRLVRIRQPTPRARRTPSASFATSDGARRSSRARLRYGICRTEAS